MSSSNIGLHLDFFDKAKKIKYWIAILIEVKLIEIVY